MLYAEAGLAPSEARMLPYYPMSRPLLLLIMLVFAATNLVAAPLALCGHTDARAHTAALKSSDAFTAAVAKGEDAAASTAEKKRMLADAASSSLIAALFPTGSELPGLQRVASRQRIVDDSELATRTLPPLLKPPLV